MNRFSKIFLIASWIIFIGQSNKMVGGLFLIFSGAYAIIDIARKWRADHER